MPKKKKGEHYRHGSDKTPQYKCRLLSCGGTHGENSKIGKDHLKYSKAWHKNNKNA